MIFSYRFPVRNLYKKKGGVVGWKYAQHHPLANIKSLKKIRGIHVMPMTQQPIFNLYFSKSLAYKIGIIKAMYSPLSTQFRIKPNQVPNKEHTRKRISVTVKNEDFSGLNSYFWLNISGSQ